MIPVLYHELYITIIVDYKKLVNTTQFVTGFEKYNNKK